MINKLMGLLKLIRQKKNVKINRLAYVTNSTFKGNNYVDRFVKSEIQQLENIVTLVLEVILIMLR